MKDLLFFSFNEKSAVLLVFFCQAVVFSLLLLRRGLYEGKKDSLWLAAFVFLGGLYICPFMLGYGGWYARQSYREFMFFFPFQQLFLIGPVFFFYVNALLNRDSQLTRKHFFHFLPAIAYLIYTIIVFVVDQLILEEFYFYADGRDKDLVFWYQMAGLISMLIYLYMSLRLYWSYRKLSVQQVSFADEIAFRWIKHFSIAFSLILLLRVLFFILNPEWGEFGSKFWYYLCFSILLMYVSFTGYLNTVKTALLFGSKPFIQFDQPESVSVVEKETVLEEDHTLAAWKNKIIQRFEEQALHKDPFLTLDALAAALDTNRSVISKAINQGFEMNFNDFVNEKRVQAVIISLEKGEHKHRTLLGIGLDCGFNSKTTFNRAFKKYTGLTPNQYIRKNEL